MGKRLEKVERSWRTWIRDWGTWRGSQEHERGAAEAGKRLENMERVWRR